MAFLLKPQEMKCFEYMKAHSQYNVDAATILTQVMTGKIAKQAALTQIDQLTTEAHTVMRETTERLEQTFITAMDRDDIQEFMDELEATLQALRQGITAYCLADLSDASEHVATLLQYVNEATEAVQLMCSWSADVRDHTAEIIAQNERIYTLSCQSVPLYYDEMNRLYGLQDTTDVRPWQDVLAAIVQIIGKAERSGRSFRKAALKYA